MAPQDHFGRIHKTAYVVSTAVLLALALAGVVIRCIIRFRMQKQRFQIDDGLFALAVSLLLTSFIIIYDKVIDPMFLLAAMQGEVEGIEIPADWLQVSHNFHKWNAAALILSWCSICAVKFYFLVFFKKLIDRLRFWQMYWWIVAIFNLGQLAFGATVYYLGCPFWDERELQCSSGRYKSVLIRVSSAQISLDIAADLLILVIPIGIIWKIKVQWTQKLVLMSSLCLTIVLVALSITRVAGLVHHGAVDTIWETYWQSLSAELGVFLAAASTFRSFFIAQRQNKANIPSVTFNRWLRSSTPRGSARKQPDSLFASWSDNTATSGFERISEQGDGDPNLRKDNHEWHHMSKPSQTEQGYGAPFDTETHTDPFHARPV
ncbi:hypothetical protein BDV36DRAFT_265156 [Aspergillus pseudocaelatus]|uniref:Rhodopsin domain-containing protein n=1 Tax=Aspergillus pseudocaelatus TaxID=1825620 RepID=A0ABQ6WBD5_9EURO|nr:hypothetical protein BDV36DRAFT_265156 [Aspergillus pseudocaelatus]